MHPHIINPITELKPKRNFEFNLEALRGFAAIIVVYGHAIYHQRSIDPNYSLSPGWVNTLSGHSSVLLFFILSGYVIGLTNKTPLEKKYILPYLRKRIVRLYPIYCISLLITLVVISHHYSIFTIIGNFIFLQNSVVPIFYENNPLWSLNNEVLYYLLFIPLSFYRLPLDRVIIALLLAEIVFGLFIPIPLLSSYLAGFIFWLSGLWLAKHSSLPKHYSSYLTLFSLLLLFLGYEFLNPFAAAFLLLQRKLNLFHLSFDAGASVAFADLAHLPFCFYIILRFTNYRVKNTGLLMAAFIIPCFVYYGHLIHKYGFYSKNSSFLMLPILFFTAGSIMQVLSIKQTQLSKAKLLPNWFIKLGTISYGIYVIHFPMGLLLAKIPFFSGSLFTFTIRLLVDLLLVLTVGYLLELKIQPWFKNHFSATSSR